MRRLLLEGEQLRELRATCSSVSTTSARELLKAAFVEDNHDTEAWEHNNQCVAEWLSKDGKSHLQSLHKSLRPREVSDKLGEWETAGGREMMLEVAAQVMAKLGGDVSAVQALLNQ